MDVADNVLDLVGRTPLVRLNRIMDVQRTVLMKLESFNPGGSVKDRIGIRMIQNAEEKGQLVPNATIVEPTSGNTGIGLALVCAIRGYHLVCVMPDKVPSEKVYLLEAYGAECILCPTEVQPEDPRSYYKVAERIAKERENAFMPQQYENPANPLAHYETTGPEIWQQTGGRITHFVAGIGTGGTISGIGRYLKEQNPDVRVIGVDTYGSVYAEYFRTGVLGQAHTYLVDGIGEDFIPKTVHFDVIDEIVPITDADAYSMTMRLARQEGILAGSSSGAAVVAACRVAEQADPGAVIVVLLPDTGERYLSKLNRKWLQEHHLVDG